MTEAGDEDRRLSRRRFLAAAAGAGAVAVAGGTAGVLVGTGLAAPPTREPGTQPTLPGRSIVPFDGVHQAGIVRPAVQQPASLVAAFDVVATDIAGLRGTLEELTTRSRLLASAWSPDAGDQLYPPPESGVVGSTTGPADLTVTISVGASLFDDRFGLGDRRPRQLTGMPVFPNDVIDPGLAHGDLLVQVSTVDRVSAIHALRYLQMGVRESLRLRWLLEGFVRPDPVATPGHTTTRNLLGFKDGTANLPADDEALLDELVWIGPDDGEPGWAVGGSYLAVRIIRMFVERWDRTALSEQEGIIGRTKRTGAPLGAGREEDEPDLLGDPSGETIPLDAHIRLANPRTPGSERNRILRRGYSYSRGFDDAGLLDQGLLFLAYQRDLAAGFVTVQGRLDGEPLEEYIRPVGGGFFFTLPGAADDTTFVGQGLFEG
jgi:deferrochelatase/peroxidase EfeB